MPPTPPKMRALIPARSGSQRCPGKNLRDLHGHPLLAYTIAAALAADVFDRGVYVSSNHLETLDIAEHYGAIPIQRPARYAQALSTDYEWVKHALDTMGDGRDGGFAILRPTSPLRSAAVIRAAVESFLDVDMTCDTLRSVRECPYPPAKLWWTAPAMPMSPVHGGDHAVLGQPLHSCPTQALTLAYVQTGGIDLCYGHLVYDLHRITGRKIGPLILDGPAAFDLNTEDDWTHLVEMVRRDPSLLPPIPQTPYVSPNGGLGSANLGWAVAGRSRV